MNPAHHAPRRSLPWGAVECAVTSEEFTTIYEQLAPTTITFLALRFQNEDLAQDAVQQAALSFLEDIERYETITPSLFKQRAYNRAINMTQRGQGHRRTRGPKPEVAAGNWFDLARVEDPHTIYDGQDPDLGWCMREDDNE